MFMSFNHLIHTLSTPWSYLWLFLFGLMLGVCLTIGVGHFFPAQPNLAVANVTGLLDQFVKAEIQKKQTPEQIKERSQVFGKNLEITMRDIAKTENLIVFPSEAIIHGARDITPLIQQRLSSGKR